MRYEAKLSWNLTALQWATIGGQNILPQKNSFKRWFMPKVSVFHPAGKGSSLRAWPRETRMHWQRFDEPARVMYHTKYSVLLRYKYNTTSVVKFNATQYTCLRRDKQNMVRRHEWGAIRCLMDHYLIRQVKVWDVTSQIMLHQVTENRTTRCITCHHF